MVLDPTDIDHLVLSFSHRGEAERFFEEVLGCRVASRTDDSSTLVVGSQRLTLTDGGAANGPLPRGLLALRVTDLDRWRRRLAAAGVPAEPVEGGEGAGRLLVEGPDGLTVELMEPPALRHRDPDDAINLF